MKPLASVIKAKYLKDYIIDLTFDDGIRSAVDFSGWLRGEIFEPLKKKSFLRSSFSMVAPWRGQMGRISLQRLCT
ncbi:MAG: hypothetical protein ACK5GN_12005 [Pseudomonadota bacterium]|jgi:hypothetical protein